MFFNVPGCSFSDTFFGHDQIGTSQEEGNGLEIYETRELRNGYSNVKLSCKYPNRSFK